MESKAMSLLEIENIIEWYYECRGSQYGYLLLNSDDEHLIVTIKNTLFRYDIICLKHNKTFKLACNGRRYKVYLTIAKKIQGESIDFYGLRKIFKNNFKNFHFDADSVEIRRYFNSLQEIITLNKDKIYQLNKELDDRFSKMKKLNKDLLTLTTFYKKNRENLAKEYSESLKIIRKNRSDNDWDKIINDEIVRHKNEEKDLEDIYETDIKYYKDQIQCYESDIRHYKAKTESLESSLENNKYENILKNNHTQEKSKSSTKENKLIKLFLGIFCVNLKFDNLSINYINDEISEPKSLLNCLSQLNDKINQVKKLPFKKFKGILNWMEIDKHITDGSSAVVRVYYKKKDNIYCVHISDKSYQQLTKNRLKEWKEVD